MKLERERQTGERVRLSKWQDLVIGQRIKGEGGKDDSWISGLHSGGGWLVISHQFGKPTSFRGRTMSSVFDTLGVAVPVQRAKVAHRTKQKVI